MDRKPEKAIQEKVRESKRMTMSRWITLRTISSRTSSKASDQSNHLRTKLRMDEILRVVKAIAEWEPHGILHIAIFLCINFLNFYDNIILLGCLSPLYKILTQS